MNYTLILFISHFTCARDFRGFSLDKPITAEIFFQIIMFIMRSLCEQGCHMIRISFRTSMAPKRHVFPHGSVWAPGEASMFFWDVTSPHPEYQK